MKSNIRQMLRSASLVLILLLAFSFSASADDTPPDTLPDLFSAPLEEARSITVDRPLDADHPEVIRTRTAEVDLPLLSEMGRSAPRQDVPAFRLNFFEDAQFDAYITRTETFANGAVGLVGTVDSEEYNELVMVSLEGVMQAYLQVGSQAFEIRFAGDGHQVVEVDQSAYPESLPPVLPAQLDQMGDNASSSVELDAGVALDSGDMIEVLAVYTSAAEAASGGTAGIETKIQTSILSTNQGYANSGITQRLNLVGMEEVSYSENSLADYYDKWYSALYRLSGQTYGDSSIYLTDARAFRETFGADLVMMITNITGSTPTGGVICGIAWVAGESWADEYGFSVVNYNCAGNSAYTPQHEMGHNMGACHDWNNTPDKSGCWGDYSFGYQNLTDNFYTVMAYSPGSGFARINQWSNPEVLYHGYPTSGLVSGQTVYPDNARTLDETANNVANWRQSITPPSPITGEFTTPAGSESLQYPRTHLVVDASSSEGTITSVTFYVKYDGSYHFVETDSNSADGWGVLWNSSDVSEQNVTLKAVVTDSAANTIDLVKSNVPFVVSLTSTAGYQARSGEGEDSSGESETAELLQPPSEEAAAAPAAEASDPVQTAMEVTPPVEETPPVTIVSEPHRHRLRIHKFFKHRWMQLK